MQTNDADIGASSWLGAERANSISLPRLFPLTVIAILLEHQSSRDHMARFARLTRPRLLLTDPICWLRMASPCEIQWSYPFSDVNNRSTGVLSAMHHSTLALYVTKGGQAGLGGHKSDRGPMT
jgi:hypothetical protein